MAALSDPKIRRSRPLIAIGICTRQRNALLRHLLESIWVQPLPSDHDVEIIIIDNNDTPSVAADLADLPPKFKLTVLHQGTPGIVMARNHLLDAVDDAGADWMLGIDDDTHVAPDWLAQFIVGVTSLDTKIIVAARHITYPATTSPYLERLQQHQKPAGVPTRVFSTANYAVHKDTFSREKGLGMRFSPALNESGAVDFEFMMRARHQHDIKALTWPSAIVTEPFDGKRATFAYHLKRRFWGQVTQYRIAAIHRQNGVRGTFWGNVKKNLLLTNRNLVFGTFKCLRGVGLLVLGRPAAREQIGIGLFKLAMAFAIFPYMFGLKAVNYGAKINADRQISS